MKNIVITALFAFSATAMADVDPVSFQKEVRPVFNKSCASCHNGSNTLPNLLEYSVAFEKRFEILQKVEDRSMPHLGRLTESERDLVKAWVQQGGAK